MLCHNAAEAHHSFPFTLKNPTSIALGLTCWASIAVGALPPQIGEQNKRMYVQPTPAPLVPVNVADIRTWASHHIQAGEKLEHLIDVCGSPDWIGLAHKIIGNIDYGICDVYKYGIDDYGNASITVYILKKDYSIWDAGEICEIMEQVANPHGNDAGHSYGATGVIYTFISPANGGEIRLGWFLPPESGSEVY